MCKAADTTFIDCAQKLNLGFESGFHANYLKIFGLMC